MPTGRVWWRSACLLLAVCFAGSQPLLASMDAEASIPPGTRIVREIDDPFTGNRWVLVRNLSRPASPEELILLSRPDPAKKEQLAAAHALAGASRSVPPVILAGDPVIVEETFSHVNARYEGIALQPAIEGATFQVRLKIGGAPVHCRALGPGRAAMLETQQGKP
ncbi:hypothetical protein ACOBR2_10135 [Telmatobacter bradus]|uniref:hypothetical protein n=1 Tax=Telmatobacter bradus TaxID=474953 RepID=UPI003B432A54